MELFVIFGGIALMIGLYIFCRVEDNKVDNAKRQDFTKRKEEELTKPRYCIQFEVFNGGTAGPIPRRSKAIEPFIFGSGISYISTIISSKDRAKEIMYRNFEDGSFTDEEDISYSACNVTNVKVVEYK